MTDISITTTFRFLRAFPGSSVRCRRFLAVASAVLVVMAIALGTGSPAHAVSTPTAASSQLTDQISITRDFLDWVTLVMAFVGSFGTVVAAMAAWRATTAANQALSVAEEAQEASTRQAASMERDERAKLLTAADDALTRVGRSVRDFRITFQEPNEARRQGDPRLGATCEEICEELRSGLRDTQFNLALLGSSDWRDFGNLLANASVMSAFVRRANREGTAEPWNFRECLDKSWGGRAESGRVTLLPFFCLLERWAWDTQWDRSPGSRHVQYFSMLSSRIEVLRNRLLKEASELMSQGRENHDVPSGIVKVEPSN